MNKQLRILLCEDDESLGMLLREFLQLKGYDIDLCPDGLKGKQRFDTNEYDLCIFDVMMPVKDGFTLTRELREAGSDVPVIFLTAKSHRDDILAGFKTGADDYITKPFSMEELVFRIEAVLRRTKSNIKEISGEYTIGIFKFTINKQMLLNTQTGESIRLTTKESELLKLLCAHEGETLQREVALKTVWTDEKELYARSMDVYITKLRKILKPDPHIDILNVHGKGYKLIVST